MIEGIHHIAMIVSDYELSKAFYLDVVGCTVVDENYRVDRNSWKLDLALPDGTQLELFTFPERENRLAGVESIGLRHLAFKVRDVAKEKARLESMEVEVEEIRTDPYTGKSFTFFKDPDGVPLELYSIE